MTIALEVFDVFGHIVPGSLYLACVIYLAERFDWLPMAELGAANSALALLVGVVLSYILGHATYDIGRMAMYRLPGRHRNPQDLAKRKFLTHCPAAIDMEITKTSTVLLAAMIEAENAALRSKIDKRRATCVMLRGCSSAFMIAAAIAIAELIATKAVAVGLASITFCRPEHDTAEA